MIDQAPNDAGQAADAAPVEEGQAKTWYDGANDETVGYIQNKGWEENPLGALESYQALEKFQGVGPDQIMKFPKDGEPMDDIYSRLGRPDEAAGYAWESTEGAEVDNTRLDMYKEVAHKAGISQEQFKALADADAGYYSEAMAAHSAAVEQKQTAELTALKSEWGDAFNERNELSRRYITANIPDGVDKNEMLEAIESAVGTATMLKLFANSGAGSQEAKLPDSGGDRPFGYSPEQAKSDRVELMQAIQSDPARLNNYNLGSGGDIDKIKRLNKIIAG